jgi:hypothetical protein
MIQYLLYFKHQYQKQQQKDKKGESDRKAYMRLYMQKRGQSDQFKVKDKEFILRSKQKARLDPLKLEQEKKAKQECRKCPEIKN